MLLGRGRPVLIGVIHHSVPASVQARLARVASAGDGAAIVSTSPAAKVVAVLIAKPALAAPAANTIVPVAVPFLAIVKLAVAVAAGVAPPRGRPRPGRKMNPGGGK